MEKLFKTIVLKPTMACNLNCKYCYESRHNEGKYSGAGFSDDELHDRIILFAKVFPQSDILWMFHGGEPLITGIDYFKKFIATLREANKNFGVNYQFAIQTNATLLNENWIGLIEKNLDLMSERVVSISLDGPPEINDAARVTKQGKSSFAAVTEAMNIINAADLNYTTISVVGRHNVNRPQEVYETVRSYKPRCSKFIPCYNFDDAGNSEMLGITPLEYADFMCALFDFWMHDRISVTDRDFVIEPIATIISNLVGAPVNWCEYRDEKCDNFTSIYPDGGLWLCDTFNPDTMKNFAYLGNIKNLSDEELAAAFLNPKTRCDYQALYEKCAACDIFNFCRGGCVPQRFAMRRASERLFKEYCAGKHKLINYIMKDEILSLENLLSTIEKGYQNGARELVISGGESTLHEEKFFACLTAAERCGYEKFIIQTNGYVIAAGKSIAKFLADFSRRRDVAISFSIHGAKGKTHDELSSSVGAFDNLLLAMKKIFQETSCAIFTNTVVTRKNLRELQEIVNLVKTFEPEIIQFAMMHAAGLENLSVGLKETALAIRGLKVNREVLKTEGLPFCFMYGLEECVGESYWPEVLDIYNRNDNYFANFNQLEHGMRWKADFCKDCLMNNICAGIWAENKPEFLRLKIRPIM